MKTEIPEECILICPSCGKILDKRNLGHILCHGWINEDPVCYEPEDWEEIPNNGCSSEGIFYPPNGEKVNLN